MDASDFTNAATLTGNLSCHYPFNNETKIFCHEEKCV